MDARSYKIALNISPFDFRIESTLGESSVSYHSEPKLYGNKIVLEITYSYILTDMFTNKEQEVLTVQSVYEIPTNEIKNREDVYEFYKDALQCLNEAYQAYKYEQAQPEMLPNLTFPNQPIENFKLEIDRFFNLLISQN